MTEISEMRAQTLSDTLFGLSRHGEDGWRDQWVAVIQAALDDERQEAEHRAQAKIDELQADLTSARCMLSDSGLGLSAAQSEGRCRRGAPAEHPANCMCSAKRMSEDAPT